MSLPFFINILKIINNKTHKRSILDLLWKHIYYSLQINSSLFGSLHDRHFECIFDAFAELKKDLRVSFFILSS